MLTELRIRNFAIIEQLEIEFAPGLVTFTGETGAGKSIIIDAVETLLGGRADATLVRSGATQASVEGLFVIPPANREAIEALFAREDLQPVTGEEDIVTLGREMRVNGRSVARINGHSVSAGLLRELGEYLVDVHGQSEHLSLLRVSQHLNMLDDYAQTDAPLSVQEARQAYRQVYQRLQAVQSELDDLRRAERNAARQSDMLTYQIKEIEGAHLHTGEDTTLLAERTRLANAEGIASLGQEILVTLDEGSPEAPAATDLLGNASRALSALARLDPSQAERYEQAQTLFEGLTDLVRGLRQYTENIEFNPRRLDQVEERLNLIQTLKRKYGVDCTPGDTIPAILEFAANARRMLEQITHAAERIEALESERSTLLAQLGQKGDQLSQKRRLAAQKIGKAIEAELNDLNMSGARFQVSFDQQPDLTGVPLPDGRRVAYHAYGLDKVEFLIAPNPGEGFKPLARIASGGETSRLMLALKNVLAKADHVPTLIFDEIDQGIGGRIGAVVGEKLWNLGRQHQVLCITHLPQLAVFGDQHYHVAKQVNAGRTITQVRLLQGQERLVELASMIGGLSEGTLQSARELAAKVETLNARR